MTGAILVALILAGSVLALATLPGTLEILFLATGFLFARRRSKNIRPARLGQPSKLAVVVPAHNEEATIQNCVSHLLDCVWLDGHYQVFVIADNCTDKTAELARQAGAQVMERNDLERRGKGWALDFAFTRLIDDFDAFIVVDADTTVESNFVREFARAFGRGADALQCTYQVAGSAGTGRSSLHTLAVNIFNQRIRSRSGWKASVGILGNGFALTSETLRTVPYHARSVVEDLEYHLRLVLAGKSVSFVSGTAVVAEMPTVKAAEESQRARWEGGRFRTMVDYIPSLTKSLFKGKWRILEPTLDLLLLPMSYHVTLLMLTLLTPLIHVRVYALISLLALFLYIALSLVACGATRRDVMALASAPFYLLWKLTLLVAGFANAKRNAAWVRTERKDRTR